MGSLGDRPFGKGWERMERMEKIERIFEDTYQTNYQKINLGKTINRHFEKMSKMKKSFNVNAFAMSS